MGVSLIRSSKRRRDGGSIEFVAGFWGLRECNFICVFLFVCVFPGLNFAAGGSRRWMDGWMARGRGAEACSTLDMYRSGASTVDRINQEAWGSLVDLALLVFFLVFFFSSSPRLQMR